MYLIPNTSVIDPLYDQIFDTGSWKSVILTGGLSSNNTQNKGTNTQTLPSKRRTKILFRCPVNVTLDSSDDFRVFPKALLRQEDMP